jgi:hypothetical protein
MAMHDLYLLADKDLSQDRERAEYSWESGAPVDDPVRQMVDLDAVRKISDASTRWRVVRMGDDNHTVATVDQFLMLSAWYTHMIHLSFGRVACLLNHIQMTAGIYGFQRLLVADKRNRISYYICQYLRWWVR